MGSGAVAALAAGVFAIVILAPTPLALDAIGPGSVSGVLLPVSAGEQTPAPAGSAPGGTLAALGVRDTPEDPVGANALGLNWTPWILLGVAAAAVGAISLTFLFARRRNAKTRTTVPASGSPEAVAPDGVRDGAAGLPV